MKPTLLDLPLQADDKNKRIINRILNTPSLLVGSIMLIILVGLAVLAPFISPYHPSDQNLYAILQPPSSEHWLGTDQLGRDLFTRLIYAARTDLKIMVLAEIIPFARVCFWGCLLDITVNG